MTYQLPINQCLILAERRISEATAWFDIYGQSDAAKADAADMEREAREFLAMATSQGWVGDADAVIAKHWALYLRPVARLPRSTSKKAAATPG